VLTTPPARIDTKSLQQFPEFVSFRPIRHPTDVEPMEPDQTAPATPQEALERAY